METKVVSASLAGIRLQDYLERCWPRVDRTALRRLVDEGQVTVNRMDVRRQQRLAPGDVVGVSVPPPSGGGSVMRRRRRAAPAHRPAVLSDHPLALCVDKPAGVPTVPERAGPRRAVHGMLDELDPASDLRVAHRLDRDTSGCLLLAKGLDGARWLDGAFRTGAVHKEYVALVEGHVAREAFEIRRSLGPDPRRPGKVAVVPDGSKRSRSAHTAVRVVERFRGYTLVTLRPTTGRGHQLRAHLRSVGHPIVGDSDYGSRGPLMLSAFKRGYKSRSGVVERPLLTRMFLHASRVEVEGGAGSGDGDGDGVPPLRAEAPLPPDLDRALAKLRRFAPFQDRDAAFANGHTPEAPCG